MATVGHWSQLTDQRLGRRIDAANSGRDPRQEILEREGFRFFVVEGRVVDLGGLGVKL